jgi:peroxiredoxin
LHTGDTTNTLKLAHEIVEASSNQAPSLALAAHVFWQTGASNEAVDAFSQLRRISSRFDLDAPIFARLAPIAEHLDLPTDWRTERPVRADVGTRPSLDSLGPFRWQPYRAPAWTLRDASHKKHSLSDYKGRPVLVVFYLGYGCVHCIEQLNTLAPAAKDFESLGISIVAIGTDSEEGLHKTAEQAKSDGGFTFPLLSDASLKAFKAYRTYDDFERMPLHGTFLVDGNGRVRWQDISYEPFTDLKFLQSEARRLLALSPARLAAVK